MGRAQELLVWSGGLCRERRLTLPSSGLAPAAQAWPSFHSGLSPRRLRKPLMSNVRRLKAVRRKNPSASRSERALKESLSKSKSIGAAAKRSLSSASSLLVALHDWSAPAQARSRANVGQSVGPLLRIGSTSAPRKASVVAVLSSGSERTSASPSASRKSGLSRSRKALVAWYPSNSYSLAMQAEEAFHTETPNPSIERTRTGMALQALISFWALRALPAGAAHVKR